METTILDRLPFDNYKSIGSAVFAGGSVAAYALGFIESDTLTALLGLAGMGGILGIAHKVEKAKR